MKNYLLGLSLIIGVSLAANAQSHGPALTLDSALSEGSQNSPRLQKAEAAAKEASWKQTETLSNFLPSLNASFAHYFDKKYQFNDVVLGGNTVDIPLIFPANAAYVNATLPVFEGFSSMNRYSAARLQSEAATKDFDWTRFQVEQDIRLKYYQALAAQKTLEVAQQNLATITEHLQQVQTLKKSGVATRYDVLRVEVQANEAQSELLQADDNVAMARQKLAISMGLENDDRELQGDLPIPDSSRLKTLKIEDNQQRTDVVALEQKTEAANKLESAAAAYWVPRINLAAQYIYYNNISDDIQDTKNYRDAYNFGVFLTWNIFDGMSSIAKSKQSVYERLQAEKSLKQVRDQLPYDFNFWKRRSVYTATLYTAKKSDLEKSQESVRLAKEGFRAGTKTNTEVLDAETDLFRARAGVVNSQMNFVESQINLEMALGRKL